MKTARNFLHWLQIDLQVSRSGYTFGWSLLIWKNNRASSTVKFLQNVPRYTYNTPTGWVLSIINQVFAETALTFFCDAMQKAVVVLLAVDLNKLPGAISSLICTQHQTDFYNDIEHVCLTVLRYRAQNIYAISMKRIGGFNFCEWTSSPCGRTSKPKKNIILWNVSKNGGKIRHKFLLHPFWI